MPYRKRNAPVSGLRTPNVGDPSPGRRNGRDTARMGRSAFDTRDLEAYADEVPSREPMRRAGMWRDDA